MKKKYILLVVIFILPIGFLFLLPRLIKITEIECQSQYGSCNPAISDKLGTNMGRNLSETRKSIKNVLQNEFRASMYSIQFKIPPKILVQIVERKPEFALKSTSSDWIALVDKQGWVLSLADQSEVTKVNLDSALPNPGERVGNDKLFALEIAKSVANAFTAKNFQLDQDKLEVELEGSPNVIFPLVGDKEVLLGSMVLVLNELNKSEFNSTIEKAKINYVDLRFKNPVLR